MKKAKKVSYYVICLLFIIAVIVGIVIKHSFKDYTKQYDNYILYSNCTEKELTDIKEKNNISSVKDIYNQADLVVYATYKGTKEVYSENVVYNLDIENIVKGDSSISKQIKVLEYTVYNNKNKCVMTLYGNIPYEKGKKYLLFLNKQEQHKNDSDSIYYISTQSILGKYLVDGNIIINNPEKDIPLKECSNIVAIVDNEKVAKSYKKFYEEAFLKY